MVNWRSALVLLAALIGLGIFAYESWPKPAPQSPPQSFLCATHDAVLVRIQSADRVVELERAAPADAWRLTRPVRSATEPDVVQYLMGSISSIGVLNTLPTADPPGAYGLDKPRETLTCRVVSGASYNLSVGNQSFDGSGYYAQKSGDSRVFVISGVAVDAFDRALAEPPVKPVPSPAG